MFRSYEQWRVIFPLLTFRNNTRVLQAYLSSNPVSYQVPISRAGTLLDGGIGFGATKIGKIPSSVAPAAADRARTATMRAAL